jgi:alanyl-tRNA synthetase
MGEWYPHLVQNRALIMSALHQEIEDFTPVIHAGLQMLQDKISRLDNDTLDGEFIFDLVTTHGLPLEVITDFTEKKGLKVDKEKYLEEYRRHQEISRSGLKGKIRAVDVKDTDSVLENALAGFEKTRFYGYERNEATGTVLGILANGAWTDEATEGTECQLVFDATPFYAESGGQVGDTGIAEGPELMAEITDTQKKKHIFLHRAIIRKGGISKGDVLNLKVDAERRKNITKNHTATHLLHASLRKVLGSHVVQKGSLVNNEKLRFDFLHNKPMTAEEISRVESLINSWIWENYGADIREMSYQDALDTGAMALFNENYGDKVRVVRFGDVSAELCGGVHVRATGEIGLVLINQEMSVAKGIRRVEAVSGPVAYNYITKSREILQTASSLVAAKPENLVQQMEKLKKNASAKVQAPVKAPVASEVSFAQEKSFFLPSGIKVFTGRLDQEPNLMQQAAEKILQNQEADIVFLASGHEETVKVIVLVSTASQGNYPADKLIRQWLEPFSGKGGGKPVMAKGGMKETGRVDELVEAAGKVFG